MALTQSHFRFGINELAESTHGWHATEDTNITFAVTTTFLLRFCIQADATGLNNVDYEFQYNLNGAGWVNITTSSTVVKAVTSVLSNGTACSERLSGTGGFTGGAGQTTDGTSGGTAHDIANNGSGETEASLQVNAGTVNPGDIIQFRVTRDVGNLLDTYAAIPALTVAGDPSVPPRALAAVLGLVLLAWQPMAPVPLQRVEIAPTIAQDVAADAPPVRDRRILTRIIAQWWKPILHGTSGVGAPVVADVPPPKSDALPRILANWAPAAPLLTRRPAFIPGSSVEAPPPRSSVTAAAIVAAWSPGPPLPQRAPPLVQGAAVAVSDPPFDGRRSSFTPIYQAWKWRPVGAGTAAAAIADVPPLRAPSVLDQILARWVPPPPVAQTGRDVATLPGASVDPPPVRRLEPRAQAIGWQPAPLQVVSVSRLVFEYAPDDPPFGLARLSNPIYAAWLPLPPAPQWGRHVPVVEVQVDAPPIIGTSRAQRAAELSWRPPPPLPQRSTSSLPSSVDPPPPTSAAGEMATIAAAWQPSPPSAQAGAHVPVSTLSINDPPFGGRQPVAAIISTWEPAPPRAQAGAHVPVSVAAVPVDDPPFSSRNPNAPIYSAWVPGPPAPYIPEYLVQPSGEPVVNDPPFGQRPWLPTTLGSWQPGPPLPWRPTWLVQAYVPDAPPVGLETALSPILSTWQPAFVLQPRRAVYVPPEVALEQPPAGRPVLPSILAAWDPAFVLPPLRISLIIQPAVAVEQPPASRPVLPGILAAWLPPASPPLLRGLLSPGIPGQSVDPPPIGFRLPLRWPPPPIDPLPPRVQIATFPGVSVDPPSPSSRALMATLRAAWEPGPPAPQWGRHVPASVSAVPVNDPPFGIRPWLPTVRARWEPGPPAPLLRLVVATESGPVNEVDFMYAGAFTMSGAGAAAVASQLAGSGRITSQRAGGGPISGDGG